MTEFKELQKVLDADTPEGVVDLAVKRISELNDSVTAKDAEISELKKKIDEEETKETKDEKKDETKDEKKEENKEEIKEETKEDEDTDEVEKLKAENKELKEKLDETEKTKTDAIEKLTDSVKKLEKKTDAIGNKQVKKLFQDETDEISELKEARRNIYKDSRGGK